MDNGMMKIDKHVPMPRDTRGTKPKYPWRLMKIGDSFFTPIKPVNLTNQKYMAQLRTGYKFSWQAVKGGTRVWRVA